MKLERTTHPKVIDTKAVGSNRIGSSATVQNVYSDSETVDEVRAYRMKGDTSEWDEIPMNDMLK